MSNVKAQSPNEIKIMSNVKAQNLSLSTCEGRALEFWHLNLHLAFEL
jgi:hypothetical protein